MAELEVDRGRVDEAVLGLRRLGLHEADRFSELAR